jgi:hypothetical protein
LRLPDVVELLKTPEIRNKLQELDLILIGNTPAAAATRTGEDFLKWGGIAKTINLQLD